MKNKVIISCEVTGGIHTPSMSPYLPITSDEIIAQSVEAAQAGASILHLHTRDPQDGRPTPDPAVFMQLLRRIKQSTDAVINITTGGGLGMSVQQRTAAARATQPEMASLNMGSMNFAIFPLLQKYKSFKHQRGPEYLEMEELSLAVASPAEARAMLGLKGGADRVAF